MNDRSKLLDVVLKLNRLTQDREIDWSHRSAYVHEGLADMPPVPERYVTEWKGKRFVLYQEPIRENSAPYRSPRSFAEALTSGIGSKRSVLEIRDSEGKTLFTFPKIAAIDDLYETVYTGRSNEVDAFFDEFLSED